MGRADATGPAANSAHPTTAAATDRLRLPIRIRPEPAFIIVSLSCGSQDPVARGCDQHPGTGLTTATNAGRNLNYDLWRNTHRRRSHAVGRIRRHIRHSVAPPESGKATPWRNSATLKLTGIAELTRLPSGGAHEVVLWQLAAQEEAVDGCGDALVAAHVGDVGITVPGQQLGGVELPG